MKKRINSNIKIFILFVLGLAILLYPTFSNWWNERRNASLMIKYEETIVEKSDEELEEALRQAQYYNSLLVGKILPDAFAEAEANSPDAEYEKMLNPAGDGFMCTVEIPVIDVRLPVYHYTTEEVLEKGVGHLPGSSLPVGGISTHSVLSAHRGLPSARLFTDLDRVKEGDIFYIYSLGDTLAYEVDLVKVIEPTDTRDLSIVEGEDYCTLFTCTPYAVNSHRLLVRGHRIPYSQEQYLVEHNKTAAVNSNMIIIRIVCVLLGIQLALAIVYISRQIARKKEKKKQDASRRSE